MNKIKNLIKKIKSDTKNLTIVLEGIVIFILIGTTIGFGVSSSKFHSSYQNENNTVELYKENENELVRNIASLNRQNEEAQTELADYQSHLEELQSRYNSLKAEKEELATEKVTLESQITNLQTQISNKETVIVGLESQISDLQSRYNLLEEENEELTTEKASLESQITNLQTQISNKETIIAGLQSQISDLETQLATMTSQANLCSVFFVFNDIIIDTKSVAKNSTVSYPAAPTVNGKFTKWHNAGTITSDKVVFVDQYDSTVTLTGSTTVGGSLTANVDNYTKQLNLVYSWYKVNASNEETLLNEDEHVLVIDDSLEGYKIKVEVTATGCEGKGSATSDEVTNPITGTITFTGDAVIGSYIISSIDTNASTYIMQWYRDNVEISGETNYSHLVSFDDCGKVLKLVVTPTDEHSGTLEKETTIIPKMSIDTFFETYIESNLTSSDDCIYESFVSAYTESSDLDKYVSYQWFVDGVEVNDATLPYIGIFDTSWLGKSLKVKLTGKLCVEGTKEIELCSAMSPAPLPNNASICLCTIGYIELNYYMSTSNYDIEWYIDGVKDSSTNCYLNLFSASDIGKQVYAKVIGKNGYEGTLTTNTITVVHKIDEYQSFIFSYDEFNYILTVYDIYGITSYCTIEWSCEGTVFGTDENLELPIEYAGKTITLTVTGDGDHVSGVYTDSKICGEAGPV